MAKIALTQGKFALIDDEDLPYVLQFTWYAARCPDGRTGYFEKWYARRSSKTGPKYLHRELMRTPKGVVVDHINGDGLDCRRENMRNTTQKHNATRKKKEEPCL